MDSARRKTDPPLPEEVRDALMGEVRTFVEDRLRTHLMEIQRELAELRAGVSEQIGGIKSDIAALREALFGHNTSGEAILPALTVIRDRCNRRSRFFAALAIGLIIALASSVLSFIAAHAANSNAAKLLSILEKKP